MRRLSLFLLLWLASSPAVAQQDVQPGPLFERGAERFDAGEYRAAAATYDSLRVHGFATAEVLFNLGNAYFRAGDLGRAVWAYRSAGRLAPRDPDIEANLTVARLAARDRIEAVPPGMIRQLWRTVQGLLSLEEGARLVTGLWLLFWLGMAVWLLWPGARRTIMPVLKTSGVLWVIAAFVLVARFVETHNTTVGVVVVQESHALSGPGGDADEVFSSHAGLECVVRGRRNEYLLVELANGRVGWMPAENLLLVGS